MSKRRTLPLDHFDEAQRAAIREQLATCGPDAALRESESALDELTAKLPAKASKLHAKRSPYTGTGNKRGMSKLEQRFAAWLAVMHNQGVVWGYAYELARVTLGVPRATKKPDFWLRCDPLWSLDGGDGEFPLVVVEVKPVDKETGKPYFGPKGRLSVKLTAARLALIHVPLYVAWPYMEDWRFERVEVSS